MVCFPGSLSWRRCPLTRFHLYVRKRFVYQLLTTRIIHSARAQRVITSTLCTLPTQAWSLRTPGTPHIQHHFSQITSDSVGQSTLQIPFSLAQVLFVELSSTILPVNIERMILAAGCQSIPSVYSECSIVIQPSFLLRLPVTEFLVYIISWGGFAFMRRLEDFGKFAKDGNAIDDRMHERTHEGEVK